jgi:hypothetical protein
LKVQVETVFVVQVGGEPTLELSHFVSGGQAGFASPPEQDVTISLWQTIPAAQSLSVEHGPGWQVDTVVLAAPLVPEPVVPEPDVGSTPPPESSGAAGDPPWPLRLQGALAGQTDVPTAPVA